MKEKRWVVFRREEDPTSIPGNSSSKLIKLGCLMGSFAWLYIHLLGFKIVRPDSLLKQSTDVIFKRSIEYVAFIHPSSYIFCSINVVVEWICWLNGQRKRAPTPEVR